MELFAGHLPPVHLPWIPAFAGMTNWGSVLVPMTLTRLVPLNPKLTQKRLDLTSTTWGPARWKESRAFEY